LAKQEPATFFSNVCKDNHMCKQLTDKVKDVSQEARNLYVIDAIVADWFENAYVKHLKTAYDNNGKIRYPF